jgi:hypothetical protein
VGCCAGEVLGTVQVAMLAGLPYTALRDAILTHPTLVEGLIPLFSGQAEKVSPPQVPADSSDRRSAATA